MLNSCLRSLKIGDLLMQMASLWDRLIGVVIVFLLNRPGRLNSAVAVGAGISGQNEPERR